MQPILLNWAANNFYGWGIVGLNLLLHWANDSEIRPLMGFPIAENDMAGVDPLKIDACREAIFRSPINFRASCGGFRRGDVRFR